MCGFQLIPKLNAGIMSELERILDNKPSRPPMISTLALRWQSMCPHGSGGGSVEEAGSPKSEGGNSHDQEQTKEVNNKMPFCEIQWDARTAISLPSVLSKLARIDMDEGPSTRFSSTSSLSPLWSRRRSIVHTTYVDTSRWQYLLNYENNIRKLAARHQSGISLRTIFISALSRTSFRGLYVDI